MRRAEWHSRSRCRGSQFEPSELAGVEHQRRHGAVGSDVVDAHQDQVVVTSRNLLVNAALQPGARLLEENRAVVGGAPVQLGEAVAVARSQLPAGLFLVGAEDADPISGSMAQDRPRGGRGTRAGGSALARSRGWDRTVSSSGAPHRGGGLPASKPGLDAGARDAKKPYQPRASCPAATPSRARHAKPSSYELTHRKIEFDGGFRQRPTPSTLDRGTVDPRPGASPHARKQTSAPRRPATR